MFRGLCVDGVVVKVVGGVVWGLSDVRMVMFRSELE